MNFGGLSATYPGMLQAQYDQDAHAINALRELAMRQQLAQQQQMFPLQMTGMRQGLAGGGGRGGGGGGGGGDGGYDLWGNVLKSLGTGAQPAQPSGPGVSSAPAQPAVPETGQGIGGIMAAPVDASPAAQPWPAAGVSAYSPPPGAPGVPPTAQPGAGPGGKVAPEPPGSGPATGSKIDWDAAERMIAASNATEKQKAAAYKRVDAGRVREFRESQEARRRTQGEYTHEDRQSSLQFRQQQLEANIQRAVATKDISLARQLHTMWRNEAGVAIQSFAVNMPPQQRKQLEDELRARDAALEAQIRSMGGGQPGAGGSRVMAPGDKAKFDAAWAQASPEQKRGLRERATKAGYDMSAYGE